jgi:glutaredoxin
LEEFLTSNGVQYEHHDLATDEPARQYLDSRGIKAAPVTIIDAGEVIIGYYPKKLIPALKLNVRVDLSGKTSWLAG